MDCDSVLEKVKRFTENSPPSRFCGLRVFGLVTMRVGWPVATQRMNPLSTDCQLFDNAQPQMPLFCKLFDNASHLGPATFTSSKG